MISPDPQSAATPIEPLETRVRAFLEPGGGLEQAIATEDFPYESRPQQLDMSLAVSGALEGEEHLAVEAGTGVGKSLAYLVPLIYSAVEQQLQVAVATYTISLQEQLVYKDIPLLKSSLGLDFKAVLVKGRGNYLCLRRLARARAMGGDLFQSEQQEQLEMLQKWSEQTKEGSLQDLRHQPKAELWDQVCVEAGNCLWQKCPEYNRCFFMRARSQVQGAHLLILNHHLLFSELALRTAGASFLPPFENVVIDEAHQVEPVASDHFGIRLTRYGMEMWLRRLCTADQKKGLLASLRNGPGVQQAAMLWDELNRFFEAVEGWAGLQPPETQRIAGEPPPIATKLPEGIRRFLGIVREQAEKTEDEEIVSELQSARRRGESILEMLQTFLSQDADDHIYWVEISGKKWKRYVLQSAPVDVAPLMQSALFDIMRSVVLTSATLAVGGEMGYFLNRIGGTKCRELQVGSPFDYARQMKLLLPAGMPEPTASGYPDALVQAIRHFIRLSGGHAFVLFTSDTLMKKTAAALEDFFAEERLTLLVQGTGMPRHAMLEAFQREPSSVLFGLDSFWMGVDVRGRALGNVLITRLPFSVPDQPVVKARMDRITRQGGNAFKEYSLPEAVLKFRQGVGRLIRTATDEGLVVILDSRVQNKWYGRLFMQALPECPVELVEDWQ